MTDDQTPELENDDQGTFGPVTFLDDLELSRVLLKTSERKNNNLERTILAQAIETKKRDIQLFEQKIQLLKQEIADYSNQISSKSGIDVELKKQYSTMVQELSRKYNLPEKWGFNPDTGEVIVD